VSITQQTAVLQQYRVGQNRTMLNVCKCCI